MRILTLLFILMLSFGFITESGKQACVDASLIDPFMACLTTYEPVCGCDGTTYFNDCAAVYQNGITQMQQGPCNCDYSWYNFPPCSSCFESVEIIEYSNNVYIAEWGDDVNCSDALSTIYNCNGTVFCMMGGIAGINTCGNLNTNYTTLNKLWSDNAFCNCYYQSWYQQPNCNNCINRVEHIAYNGNTYIVFWADDVNCSDAMTTVYNCDGSIYCQKGGIAGINTCSTLPYNYTIIETLWDNQTDCNVIDLALRMTLQPGQPNIFNQGDVVIFDITIFNQGNANATLIEIVNYIPQGLLLSDPNWVANAPNTAMTQISGPIFPQDSLTISIALYVEDDSFCQAINAAEMLVTNDIDSNGDTLNNNDITVDNETNNANNDEDDHDIELIGINCQNCPPLLDLGAVDINTGIYQASVQLRSAGTVVSGNNVLFKAGSTICLNSGFTVIPGAEFSAKIAPCSCNLPAPGNLNLVKKLNDEVTLSWDETPGAFYYLEYYVNDLLFQSIPATSPITVPLEEAVYHEFTIFSNCDDSLTAGNAGRTVSYTLSADCEGCTPPSNLDATLNGDSLLVDWNPSEGEANFYVIELLDENGNALIGEGGQPVVIQVDNTGAIIDLSNIPNLPDAFEIVLSVDCRSNLGNTRMVSKCHSIRGMIIVVGDVAKHAYYCNNKEELEKYYTICCEHVSGATPDHFLGLHGYLTGPCLP